MAYSTVAVSQKPLEAVTRKFKFISELWNTDVRMAEERSFCLSDPDPRGVSECCWAARVVSVVEPGAGDHPSP